MNVNGENVTKIEKKEDNYGKKEMLYNFLNADVYLMRICISTEP